ncbi:MspA family porin [Nocardia mexicana]|uniref:MspA family porin n=1 Tax=Nocardia mexicana TaxID=279262 RepID=UPI001471158B|nr:MspA family porin [Nocardia mexicana]
MQSPFAVADTVAPAPREQTVKAKDGRTLVVGQRTETVDRLVVGPSLMREARVGNEAYAMVSGKGKSSLREATLTIGYHVGCAVAFGKIVADLSGVFSALGMKSGTNLPKSSITIVPKSDGPPQVTSTKLYPGIVITPKVEMTLQMGSVAEVPLATGPVRNSRGLLGIREADVKIDGCLGPAAIRSYAKLTTKSALADETVVVYGDPVNI